MVYPAPVGPVVDLSWFIMVYHGLSWFIMVYHGLSHYVPCFIITIHSLAMGIAVKKKWFYWLSMWLYVYELLPEYNYYRHDDYRHEHEQLRISQSK